MNEVTILKQRISTIAYDARKLGQTDIADKLEEALSEFRKNHVKAVTELRLKNRQKTTGTMLSQLLSQQDSSIKENVKRDIPPKPPIERNPKETNKNSTAGAREGDSAKTPQKSNNTDKPKEPEKRFVKPTLQEVAAYVAEKNYKFDPEAFWNFYESKGWKVGRVSMKSWKSACVTWQKSLEGRLTRQQEIDAKMDERYARRYPRNEQDEADKAALARVEKARQESIELIRRLHNVH